MLCIKKKERYFVIDRHNRNVGLLPARVSIDANRYFYFYFT